MSPRTYFVSIQRINITHISFNWAFQSLTGHQLSHINSQESTTAALEDTDTSNVSRSTGVSCVPTKWYERTPSTPEPRLPLLQPLGVPVPTASKCSVPQSTGKLNLELLAHSVHEKSPDEMKFRVVFRDCYWFQIVGWSNVKIGTKYLYRGQWTSSYLMLIRDSS